MLSNIIGIILVLVFGSVMVYFAQLQGHSQFLMAIASFAIILYLVVKDLVLKVKKKREEELKKNPSKRASKKKSSVSISEIAHRSTKDKK